MRNLSKNQRYRVTEMSIELSRFFLKLQAEVKRVSGHICLTVADCQPGDQPPVDSQFSGYWLCGVS
jgi:hypothetical protein